MMRDGRVTIPGCRMPAGPAGDQPPLQGGSSETQEAQQWQTPEGVDPRASVNVRELLVQPESA
jgi:hypothetical protein